MQYQINLKKHVLLFASVVLLSACQSESNAPATVKFSPPERIVKVRAIDLSLVRPVVQLGNGTLITMQPGDDNSWTGSIRVQPNQSYQLMVNWIETLPQGDLTLAQYESSVDVGEDGENVIVSPELYDYSADFDGDSIPNINEREDGTDPFDPTNGAGGATQGSTTNGDTAGNTTGDTTAGGTSAGDDTTTGGTSEGTDTGTGGTTAGSGTTTGSTDEGTDTGTGDTTAGSDTTTGSTTTGSETTSGSTSGSTTGDTTAGSTAGATDGGTGVDTEGDTDGTSDGTSDGNDTTGTVHTKASVFIPRISSNAAPSIDGEDVVFDSAGNLTGEWEGAVEVDDAGATLWINNLMIDNGADSDDGAELRRWAAMHDGENLYILVLSDDVGRRTSDSLQPWNDDSLELFIDGDNSKLTEYGDADDFHILLPLQPLNSTSSNNELTGRSQLGPMSSEEELDYEFSTGIGIGPDGIRQPRFELDVYEVAVPLDDANITPGFPAGLELQLNDDDDGDQRDSKWGWFHLPFTETDNPDESYTNPSIMGTVVLEE